LSPPSRILETKKKKRRRREKEELPAPTGAENSGEPDSGDSSSATPEAVTVAETVETPAAAGNDAPHQPGQARLAALRAKYGGDYLDVAAACAEAQEQAGALAGFTTPAQAGGADSFADGPLAAFCDLVGARPDLLSDSERRSWPRKLRELAEPHGLDAAEMARCIALLPHSDWAWRVKSFTSPYAGGFDEVISALIRRRLAGQPVAAPTASHENGRRPREGVWTEDELETARREALSESPIDVESLLGRGA
jgi:hypothetical protein